jgi:hypothetical protein
MAQWLSRSAKTEAEHVPFFASSTFDHIMPIPTRGQVKAQARYLAMLRAEAQASVSRRVFIISSS